MDQRPDRTEQRCSNRQEYVQIATSVYAALITAGSFAPKTGRTQLERLSEAACDFTDALIDELHSRFPQQQAAAEVSDS